jgi:hypothetical protein
MNENSLHYYDHVHRRMLQTTLERGQGCEGRGGLGCGASIDIALERSLTKLQLLLWAAQTRVRGGVRRKGLKAVKTVQKRGASKSAREPMGGGQRRSGGPSETRPQFRASVERHTSGTQMGHTQMLSRRCGEERGNMWAEEWLDCHRRQLRHKGSRGMLCVGVDVINRSGRFVMLPYLGVFVCILGVR